MKRLGRFLVRLLLIALVGISAFILGRAFERYIRFIPVELAHPATVRESAPGALPLSPADRLYGLGLVWEKARYNFPFFDRRAGLDWDAAYRETIPAVMQARDDLEYYRVLQRFAARLKDGHSRVQLPQALQDLLDRPPLLLDVYREGLFISRWLDPAEKMDRYLGARLSAVDGKPVEQVVAELQPSLSASTPQDLWARTADGLLAGPAGSEVTLAVQLANGQTETLSVRRNLKQIQAGKNSNGQQMILTRDLGDGIRYVRILTFTDPSVVKQFDQAFPNFRGVKGLVIDVRDNGGGNSGYGDRIFSRLIRWPARNVKWQSRERVAFADAAKMGELWFYGPPGIVMPRSLADQYSGPVVVLTNARTYSAAENFTALFQINRRGKTIGEATGGSTGQPVFFQLPGGGTGAVVTKWDLYPDGKEFVGVGIQPDLPVSPTPADWAAGRDPVLEKAAAVLEEQ